MSTHFNCCTLMTAGPHGLVVSTKQPEKEDKKERKLTKQKKDIKGKDNG